LAGKGSTCLLTLTINGSLIPQQGIHEGPVLCQQGNSNQCYQPSSGHGLNVVKSSNPPPVNKTMISTTPPSFGFTAGGTTQIVTLTNNGPAEAYNIHVITAPGLGVSVSNKCPASLPYVAPNNTCQLTFTSGSATGTTSATIAGSNTNTLTENITVNPALVPLAITGGGTMTLYTNDVNAVGWLVIKNNSSSVTATNIAANFTGTALSGHVTQDASNCASVIPGASCILHFTVSGTTPIPATDFGVSGSNTTQETGNLTISTVISGKVVGDSLNGGYVASLNVMPSGPGACGTTTSTTYLVAAFSDYPSSLLWDSSTACSSGTCTQTNATDPTQGSSNTNTIVSTLIGEPGVVSTDYTATPSITANYAAGYCSGFQIDASGHTPCQSGVCYEGWYLPAQTELYCLYNNYQSNIGGFSANQYWNSTEDVAISAWMQDFADGNQYAFDKFDPPLRVRCVRAISN
jgi:hypothetical protein